MYIVNSRILVSTEGTLMPCLSTICNLYTQPDVAPSLVIYPGRNDHSYQIEARSSRRMNRLMLSCSTNKHRQFLHHHISPINHYPQPSKSFLPHKIIAAMPITNAPRNEGATTPIVPDARAGVSVLELELELANNPSSRDVVDDGRSELEGLVPVSVGVGLALLLPGTDCDGGVSLGVLEAASPGDDDSPEVGVGSGVGVDSPGPEL